MLCAACGSGGGRKTTTTTASSAPTTLPKPVANIVVRPPSGNVGTSFTLIGTGFRPGESVTFEIDFPDGKRFGPGQAHKTTPDGALQTTYKATPGNPQGTYTVRATGDMGTAGQGQFTLGTAVASTTTTR